MSNMKLLQQTSLLAGANSPWLEQQYEQYLKDPNTVDESWREYFEKLPMINGHARDIPHSDVRAQFFKFSQGRPHRAQASSAGTASDHALKQIYVTQLINAYRVRGHQLASLDPLGRESGVGVREVRLHENGLSEADLDTVFATPALEGMDEAPLRRDYCPP